MNLVSDPKAIVQALRIFMEPGQVVEIRAPKVRGRFPKVNSGYFDSEHLHALAEAVVKITTADAIYFMLNPVKPELLARAYNRIKEFEKGDSLTTDKEIVRRTWLMIDLDAKRNAGISATDEEKAASLLKFIDILEDNDDVQDVFANFEMSDEVMEKLASGK